MRITHAKGTRQSILLFGTVQNFVTVDKYTGRKKDRSRRNRTFHVRQKSRVACFPNSFYEAREILQIKYKFMCLLTMTNTFFAIGWKSVTPCARACVRSNFSRVMREWLPPIDCRTRYRRFFKASVYHGYRFTGYCLHIDSRSANRQSEPRFVLRKLWLGRQGRIKILIALRKSYKVNNKIAAARCTLPFFFFFLRRSLFRARRFYKRDHIILNWVWHRTSLAPGYYGEKWNTLMGIWEIWE